MVTLSKADVFKRSTDRNAPGACATLASKRLLDHLILCFVCLFLLLYVPSQQLWSLRDGQFT